MKKLGVLILLLAFVITGAGCGNTTTSSSVDGASLVFGLNVDQKTPEIKDPATTFKAKQEIYYLFNNNEAFGSDKLTIQLKKASDEVLLEQSYDVGADNSIYINTVGFNNPGTYKVLMLIDGKVRAQQSLIIE